MRMKFPTALAFEPLQLCNAACFCCPYTWLQADDEYRGIRMPRENITRLLTEFGSCRNTHNYNGSLHVNPFRYSDPLLCADLDLILDLCANFNMKLFITTNGIGMSQTKLKLLNEYHHVIQKISISLMGSSREDVDEFMGIDFNKIIRNVLTLAENSPDLRPLTRVTLRVVRGTEEERLQIADLFTKFESVGISVKGIKENWITNRVNNSDFFDKKAKQSVSQKVKRPIQVSDRFVNGCGWSNNLIRRLEVMVDGDVVLCCDDAEKNKVFGNVFEDGIEKIWNGPLKREQLLIMQKTFQKNKNSLICSTCSRAEWSASQTLVRDL